MCISITFAFTDLFVNNPLCKVRLTGFVMTWHTALAFTMAILATSVLAADDNSVVDNPSGI